MAKRTTDPQARPTTPRRSRSAPDPQPSKASETMTAAVPGEVEDEVSLASTSMASEPSEEDIRMRAYHRYLERGGGHGMDFEDWLEAERELKLTSRKSEV